MEPVLYFPCLLCSCSSPCGPCLFQTPASPQRPGQPPSCHPGLTRLRGHNSATLACCFLGSWSPGSSLNAEPCLHPFPSLLPSFCPTQAPFHLGGDRVTAGGPSVQSAKVSDCGRGEGSWEELGGQACPWGREPRVQVDSRRGNTLGVLWERLGNLPGSLPRRSGCGGSQGCRARSPEARGVTWPVHRSCFRCCVLI